MIEDLRQPAVAGPSVQVNEVRGDADGPFLIQRQCDEFGPVLAIRSGDINSAAATRAPVAIDDQVQATGSRQTGQGRDNIVPYLFS